MKTESYLALFRRIFPMRSIKTRLPPRLCRPVNYGCMSRKKEIWQKYFPCQIRKAEIRGERMISMRCVWSALIIKIILRLPFTGIWRAAATKARSASAFIIMMRLKIRLRKRHLLQVRNRLPSQKMSLVRWYIIIRVLPFCTFLQTELYIGSIWRKMRRKCLRRILLTNGMPFQMTVILWCIRPEGKQISPRRFI